MGRSSICLERAVEMENDFLKFKKRKERKRNLSASSFRDESHKGRRNKITDLESNGKLVKIWAPRTEIDDGVAKSIRALTHYPDIYPYIAIMPDFHIGESSVNGSIIPSEKTLYVNAIGGDLGCGMTFVDLGVSVESIREELPKIYGEIYDSVPTGKRFNVEFDEGLLETPLFNSDIPLLNKTNKKLALQHFGSLGRGNHFIEVQEGEEGQLGLMIHTGSRGVGQLIRKIGMKDGTFLDRPKGLVVLDSESTEGKEYLMNMDFAVRYASANRFEILKRVYDVLKNRSTEIQEIGFEDIVDSAIDVPHNYISRERHFGKDLYVHRKGAVNLLKDQLGIIPGSMGTHSYVVRGRGNVYSFNSSSHGAGRVMSSGKALNTVNPKAFEEAMAGIISRKDGSVYGEAPQAYRDIDLVLGNQKDLVKKVSKWSPVLSVKG